jgi:hypothetical protein
LDLPGESKPVDSWEKDTEGSPSAFLTCLANRGCRRRSLVQTSKLGIPLGAFRAKTFALSHGSELRLTCRLCSLCLARVKAPFPILPLCSLCFLCGLGVNVQRRDHGSHLDVTLGLPKSLGKMRLACLAVASREGRGRLPFFHGTLGKSKNVVKVGLGTLVRLETGLPASGGKEFKRRRCLNFEPRRFSAARDTVTTSTYTAPNADLRSSYVTPLSRLKKQKTSAKCGLSRCHG